MKTITLSLLLLLSTSAFAYDTVVKVLDKDGSPVKNIPVTVVLSAEKLTLDGNSGFPMPVYKSYGVDEKIWLTDKNGEAQIDLSLLKSTTFLKKAKYSLRLGVIAYSAHKVSEAFYPINEVKNVYSLVLQGCADIYSCNFTAKEAPANLLVRAKYSTAGELQENATEAFEKARNNDYIIPMAK